MTTTAVRRVGAAGFGRVLQHQGALIALVALVALGTLRYGSSFATGFNVESVLAANAKFALIALGMTFVIIAGGIDLSVGSVAALGGVVAVELSDTGVAPSFAAAVVVGASVGLVNGLLVARSKLAPFLVTLATLLIARGLALYLADSRSAVASAESNFQEFGRWSVLGVPVAFLVALLFFAVGAGALRYTGFGRNVLAVGGNEDAARLMGLPVERTQALVYVLSGSLAGLAGAFLGAQSGSVNAAAGQGWELTAIAAVVVGGTLLTGGVGSVLGSLVGVLLLQLVFNLIVFENSRGQIEISSYWESVIRGGYLLLVVLLQVRLTRGGRAAAA